MSNSLIRLLKIASVISDSGDIEAFNSFCVQFDAFVSKNNVINKTAHMEPRNDGTTPNPWRKNLDYHPWENSPYYGSVSEFMKKFPGGIREWVEWRNKTEKERFQLWDPEKNKKRVARLESLMKQADEDAVAESIWELEKEAHFEPVGPDNTKDFPNESHLYSGDENVGSFKSVREYIEKRRKETGQNSDDAAMDAAKDFVNYYKLLLKGKNRRKKD